MCGGGGSWGFGPYFGCFPPRSVAQSSGSAAQRARGGLWAPLGSWSSSGGLGEAGREETSLGTKQGSGRPLEEVSAPSVQKGRCRCPGRPGWGWMDEAGKRPAGFFLATQPPARSAAPGGRCCRWFAACSSVLAAPPGSWGTGTPVPTSGRVGEQGFGFSWPRGLVAEAVASIPSPQRGRGEEGASPGMRLRG